MTYPYSPGYVKGSATSAASAASLAWKVSALQRLTLQIIALHSPVGITDEQLDVFAHRDPRNPLRPRRVELMQMGLVCDSGRRDVNSSGKEAVLWITAPRKRVIPRQVNGHV
jgi:hypothetical protein